MAQQDVTSEDMIFGTAVLAVFLGAAVGAGVLLSRFRNRRYSRAWQTLTPLLVNTKITSDGGGAATSWLSGNFRGRLVHASMSPGVARSTGSALKGNRFSIIVPAVDGKHSWTAQHIDSIPLVHEANWRLDCENEPMQQQLQNAGIVERLQNHGVATVRYTARERKLVWEALIEPYWVLPPEHFTSTTETLFSVADDNALINR